MNDLGAEQSRATNAAMNQQASAANAAAMARDQFVGQTANSNEMAAQQANLQTALSGAGGWDQAPQTDATPQPTSGGSTAAMHAAAVYERLEQSGCHAVDAADQVYNMGSDRYQMGMDAHNAMGDVGNAIDSRTRLIDAQRRDFERLTGAPQDQYAKCLRLSAHSRAAAPQQAVQPRHVRLPERRRGHVRHGKDG